MQTKKAFDERQVGLKSNQLQVLRIIQQHLGRDRAITDEAIAQTLGRKISFERAVRQAIHEMRKQRIPICGESGVGYWWPVDLNDVKATRAELMSRAKSIMQVAALMMEGGINMFGAQDVMELELTQEHEI